MACREPKDQDGADEEPGVATGMPASLIRISADRIGTDAAASTAGPTAPEPSWFASLEQLLEHAAAGRPVRCALSGAVCHRLVAIVHSDGRLQRGPWPWELRPP